jgi:predicted PurR-regulated permease PerM
MKTDGFFSKINVQTLIFLGVFALFFILVARLFMPFFTIILWAAILYVLIDPLYVKLSGIRKAKLTGKKPNSFRRAVLAGLLSVLAVVVIVVPLGFLSYLLIRQSSQVLGDILDFVKSNPFLFKGKLSAPLAVPLPEAGIAMKSGLPPLASLGDFLYSISGGAINLGSTDLWQLSVDTLRINQKAIINFSTILVRNLGTFILALAFMTFTLYFFLMDGHYLLGMFVKAIPIKNEYMQKFIHSFRDTTRQLIRGNLMVALIQGTIAFILFLVFRVRGALLLSVMVSICSFIPMVGAGTIWLPVSATYIIMTDPIKGIILLLLSAVGISLLDNFYRPILVGGPIKIHPLPIFFAIVGGVSIFGINGLIIGPLILALFFAALDIFRELWEIPKTPMEEAEAKVKPELTPKAGEKAGSGGENA